MLEIGFWKNKNKYQGIKYLPPHIVTQVIVFVKVSGQQHRIAIQEVQCHLHFLASNPFSFDIMV